mgnify:CR=1 FL=1
MRHSSSGRRSRNRGNGNKRNQNNRSQVFDSNGPEVRIRGTAFQVNEKYMALAKDAAAGGDLVLAESYYQYAEHYQRIINGWNEEDEANANQQQQQQPQQDRNQQDHKSANKNQGRKPSRQQEQSSNDDLALPASMLTPAGSQESQEELAD